MAAEGGQRLRVRPHGAEQVVPAVAAAHQQARACTRAPLQSSVPETVMSARVSHTAVTSWWNFSLSSITRQLGK